MQMHFMFLMGIPLSAYSLIASNRYSKKEYYEAPTSKQEDVKIEF